MMLIEKTDEEGSFKKLFSEFESIYILNFHEKIGTFKGI